MRHTFGWSYPPGAENDPLAPWNQDSMYSESALEDGFDEFGLSTDVTEEDIDRWFEDNRQDAG